jgi:sarcosine oxidase, subunit alpha
MESSRIDGKIIRGKKVEITVDEKKITAYEGETIAGALIAAGIRTFNYSSKAQNPRSIYCGIGLCYNCIMIVDGVPNTKTCQTLVKDGCTIQTQKGLGELEVKA